MKHPTVLQPDVPIPPIKDCALSFRSLISSPHFYVSQFSIYFLDITRIFIEIFLNSILSIIDVIN